MHRKLWPKAPAEEGDLGQMSKFSSLLYTYKFLEKPNKKNYNRVKKFYCDAIISVFLFLIVYLPKKMKDGPRLPTLPYAL